MNSNPSEAEEEGINLFLLPINEELDEFAVCDSLVFLLWLTNSSLMLQGQRAYGDSYQVLSEQFRNQILGMPKKSFSRPLSEREWYLQPPPLSPLFLPKPLSAG